MSFICGQTHASTRYGQSAWPSGPGTVNRRAGRTCEHISSPMHTPSYDRLPRLRKHVVTPLISSPAALLPCPRSVVRRPKATFVGPAPLHRDSRALSYRPDSRAFHRVSRRLLTRATRTRARNCYRREPAFASERAHRADESHRQMHTAKLMHTFRTGLSLIVSTTGAGVDPGHPQQDIYFRVTSIFNSIPSRLVLRAFIFQACTCDARRDAFRIDLNL